MRLVHYYITEKNTDKRVSTNCSYEKTMEILNKMENKENYKVTYRFVTI